MNWFDLIPSNWTGPILLRSADYLKNIQHLIFKYPKRVVHNSLLVLFAIGVLPSNIPDPIVCTKATMWAMPEISSAIYIAQFSNHVINSAIARVSFVNFENY